MPAPPTFMIPPITVNEPLPLRVSVPWPLVEGVPEVASPKPIEKPRRGVRLVSNRLPVPERLNAPTPRMPTSKSPPVCTIEPPLMLSVPTLLASRPMTTPALWNQVPPVWMYWPVDVPPAKSPSIRVP